MGSPSFVRGRDPTVRQAGSQCQICIPRISLIVTCFLADTRRCETLSLAPCRFFLRFQIQMAEITNRVTLRLEKAKVTASP